MGMFIQQAVCQVMQFYLGRKVCLELPEFALSKDVRFACYDDGPDGQSS